MIVSSIRPATFVPRPTLPPAPPANGNPGIVPPWLREPFHILPVPFPAPQQ